MGLHSLHLSISKTYNKFVVDIFKHQFSFHAKLRVQWSQFCFLMYTGVHPIRGAPFSLSPGLFPFSPYPLGIRPTASGPLMDGRANALQGEIPLSQHEEPFSSHRQ